MKRLSIKEVLEELYSEKTLSQWEDYGEPLYYYIEGLLGRYKDFINSIAEEEFCTDLNEVYFKGHYSKRRLQNLIHRLEQDFMGILQSCYKGDIYYANKLLYNLLLCKNSKISQYLVEPYINYFEFSKLTDKIFYRMRDEEIGKEVNDCSHVPFNLRYKIDSNRFSLQGLPCLYLANSTETADKELHTLEDGKHRWVSEFVPIKDFAMTDLRFRGIDIPSNIDIYDAFKLLITFPIRLLCSIKVKNEEDNFHEEYYFPQLLSHLILVYIKEHPNDNLYHGTDGIMFDSTMNVKGYNLVIPASYSDNKPPQYGHSLMIKNLLKEQNLRIYKKNATSTT